MVVLPFVPVTPTTRSSRARVAVEAGRERSHRVARGLHHQFRHAQTQRPLHHQRRRPRLHCLRRELVPVSLKAAHAEEQIPRLHAATVIGQARDLHSRARPGSIGGDQLVEPHGLMLSRRDMQVGQRERHDLPERRRRHRPSEDRPGLRFIDDHRTQQLRVRGRRKADERGDVGALWSIRRFRGRSCWPCPSCPRVHSRGSTPRWPYLREPARPRASAEAPAAVPVEITRCPAGTGSARPPTARTMCGCRRIPPLAIADTRLPSESA